MSEPRVYFGQDHIPARHENASGGIIKVQDLERLFPNTTEKANILYLISSTISPSTPVTARYAKKRGAKLIINQNGTAYPAWHGPGWEKTNDTMRQLLEIADYVVYQSDFCKRAADLHLVERKERFEILYNPVDTGVFLPAEHRPQGLCLISAGTHRQLYRVECALKAAEIVSKVIPEVSLTFAGQYHWRDDHDLAKAELRDLVQASNLRDQVNVVGKYSQNEVVPLLQKHHIALHTKYNDPCPRLVSEALACGLPVVFSHSGGVPELVGPKAGMGIEAPLDWNKLHAPPPAELADAVIEIWRNYDTYSVAARERSVQALDVRSWTERHANIFKDILI